jgi:glutamyl-tRNA reductase
MRILLVGMNHKTAPVEIRERLQLACGDEAAELSELLAVPEVREALVLSTCNRVEVLARVAEGEAAERRLKEFILRQGNLGSAELERCLYVLRERDAIRHLFRVASSLDSLVMGEPQILGQVKDAYRRAVEHRATGLLLNRLVHHAFRTAKRVRTETGIAGNAVSVSYAAVELAKKIFGGLQGKSILLVGAGEMAELAARHLLRQGVGRILVANRTAARAAELAGAFRGEAVAFEGLREALAEVDIVISSTGAPGFVVTAEMVSAALHRRRNRLLFLIDIAVPRDIDPEAGEIDNVYLYNIDHLQGVVDANREVRRAEADRAEAVVAEEVERFEAWFNALAVVPTIVALRARMEGILQGEMEKSSSWLEGLPAGDRSRVEQLVSTVVNKILHDPISGLKEESLERDELPYVAALRRLFRLGQGQ